MSSSDDFSTRHPAPHVSEDLPALIAGELDLDATRTVTSHLRACPACQQELVEVAAGIGMMRRLDDLPLAAPAPAPVPERAPTRTPRSRALVLVAAAVVLVLAGVVTTALLFVNRGDNAPQAKVELAPVANGTASGTVSMRASGAASAMNVDTSLDPAPANRYYEVWLLDRSTGKMLPVGVLPPDGHGIFRLPGEILAGYDSVDISLQPNDGSTQHSDDSVLRANYS